MSSPRGGLDAAIATALRVTSLTTLATDGVHNTRPPDTVIDPNDPSYVVYAHEDESFRYTFDKREWQVVYRFVSVGPTAWPKDAAAMDAQIDELLHGVRLTVSGFTHTDTQREQSGDLPADPNDGPPVHSISTRYRFWLDEAL